MTYFIFLIGVIDLGASMAQCEPFFITKFCYYIDTFVLLRINSPKIVKTKKRAEINFHPSPKPYIYCYP